MKRSEYKIAITSVGGGVGQSILKALQAARYSTVALDADPLAAGLYASAISYIVPHSHDPKYIDSLLNICKKEKCRLLFPGSDTELLLLSKNKELFAKHGIQISVSDTNVITLADDKLLTFERLSEAGIAVPDTQTYSEFNKKPRIKFPFVLKPKKGGSRSQNVKVISTKKELEVFVANKNFDAKNTVVQEYIDSEEYTCGSVTLDGQCWGVIVMRRILRDGDTYKCFSVRDEVIEEYVKKVVEEIKPFGACNIQLRLKNGVPHVFEINARSSGTTAARALAGFNEPATIADYLLLKKKPRLSVREISILRYWKELVVENTSIKSMRKKGFQNKSTEKL